MWYLTSETDPRLIYVTSTKEVTIGRSIEAQNCDFAISDPSISRRHVTLSISNNCLVLQDLGSRYGTFLNNSNEKIEANNKVAVKAGDLIKFGKFSCVWKVSIANFVTCTSTLKGENLQNLKTCLIKLDGILKNEWDDTCVYLTMPGITLTIKVVLALVQGSSIVTTDFWQKCVEAVDNNTALPNPNTFIPQIVESTLNKEIVSFLPNEKRKKLFDGKKFIFFSRRQLDMYKAVLMKSSGSALLLSESKMSKSMLCDEDIIVIQYNLTATSQETQAQRDQINEIVNYLKSNNKRLIADAEIGLSILYCSLDKYCNPNFNFPTEIIRQPSEQNTKKTNILAPESQESTNKRNRTGNVVINESLTSREDSSSTVNNLSSKRKLGDDDIQTNATKKMATETPLMISSIESAKRKFTEESSTSQINPPKRMAVGTENDDEDFFNFVDSKSVSNVLDNDNKSLKKLNFLKPLQKKQGVTNKNEADEDLFNFVEKPNSDSTSTTNYKIFNKSQQLETKKTYDMGKDIDITILRGSKLKELMESNLNYDPNTAFHIKTIKKEETDKLGESLSNLDLGTTIVKVRSDLIVKKEALELEAQNNQVKNFKKFRKVWPVKMQVTVIPRSTMSIIQSDNSVFRDIPLAI